MVHGQHTRRKKLWKSWNKQPSPSKTSTVVIKNYVTCSVQTEDDLPYTKKQFGIQDLESVTRITNFPIVESGWNFAENVYSRIKKFNGLVEWTLVTAETSVQTVFEATAPALSLFQGPITSIDKLVCRSLDVVEQTVPSINLPPEVIYWNTKQYVTDVGTKLARPVLERADSVKQIGNTVLSSKYTAFAADTLDGALNVADKYVDKYLPPDNEDQTVDEVDQPVDGPTGKAIHTIHHADRFSRKLKRRVTQRTMAEVKALKQQSAEAVHVLIYVAELVATDPKLAFQKGKELWASLSKDEPENQARPENVEQLIVLLTRESARRVVHLINFSSSVASELPRKVTHSLSVMVRNVLALTDSMVKTIHMEEVQKTVVDVLRIQGRYFAVTLKQVNEYLSEILEQVAENLANPEAPKLALSVPQIKVQTLKATHVHPKPNSNGVENN